MKKAKRLFVLRGADHERYLRSLLGSKSITAKYITYEKPPLLRRLIGSLMMGEQIDNGDVQRVIHALERRQKGDYVEWVSLQKKSELMTGEELQARLSQQ